MTLRVGVIGCGQIVQSVHLNILARLPEVRVVAFADPDIGRLDAARRRIPAAVACADYGELVERADVDAVLICGPNGMHAAAALAALERGKHVYLEKPIATTLEDGRRIVDAWRRAGVVGMVGFNYRFNPLYSAARRHLESGRIGRLVGARSVFATVAKELPKWRRSRQSGGGVLLDLASHHVDLMRFLLGREVIQVSAITQSWRSEGDTAALQILLEDDLPVQSFFSMNAVEEDRFEVYGASGRITVDRYRSFGVQIRGLSGGSDGLAALSHVVQALSDIPFILEKLRAPAREPSYRPALAHFVAAAQSSATASPDLQDGYRSLAVIMAAEESARSGRAIPVRKAEAQQIARDAAFPSGHSERVVLP